jgi:hypothetical protein
VNVGFEQPLIDPAVIRRIAGSVTAARRVETTGSSDAAHGRCSATASTMAEPGPCLPQAYSPRASSGERAGRRSDHLVMWDVAEMLADVP